MPNDCDCNHQKLQSELDYLLITHLRLQLDRLWGDHYWETRQVIRSAVSNNSCLSIDIEALYQNQDNIGANFAKLVDNVKAGEELALALREHITIAIEIVVAAIAGKPIESLYRKWQENAVVIAKIYHKYNKRISFDKMNEMMQEHLATTLTEAVVIIEGNCKASQITGDLALEHIRMMASYINSKF